jgi:hypothetical protein
MALGGQIRILGSGLAGDQLRPGDAARVEVSWQALVQPPDDYTVFVHLMSEDGHLVAQHDGPPLGGAFPTTDWDAGDTVDDAIDLPIPADLSPGRYDVVLGMYRPDTGARLADPSGANEYAVGAVTVQ